jgi:N-acetylmuramoyl-L-alanine amidase
MIQKIDSDVIKFEFIAPNPHSRSQQALQAIRKLVVHYTANPGASARNHKTYFANLSGSTYASAHIFVDKLEAICIIPLNEVAYHANDVQKHNSDGSAYRGVAELKPNANYLSIGVELCIEKDGTFHPDTLARAEKVFAELCKAFKLDPNDDIVRHFDITAKNCPAPFVANAKAFADFKNKIDDIVNPPAPKPVVDKKHYTVVDGDTLYKIAKKTGVSVDNLIKYNPKIKPDELQIGDILNLVATSTSTTNNKPKPKATKKYLVLPKSSDSWNVYPTNKAPVKANACGQLNPKKYGGLTYEIIGNPQDDVYTIDTDSFGKVNIYASKATGAKIVTK